MKALIAIVNARHREAWRDAIRRTWFYQVPKEHADVFFFMGRGEPRQFAEDEIELDCSDKYEHLPEKVREMCKWALQRDYHHMLKCDDDVVLKPKQMLSSGYEQYDFSGKGNRPPQPYVVSYGFNYWMSRKSLEIVTSSSLPLDGSNDDEKWVANNLWNHGIALHNVDRYRLHTHWEDFSAHVTFRRSLRVPRQMQEEARNPEVFSRCIHIDDPTVPEKRKLTEFFNVYQRYGEL